MLKRVCDIPNCDAVIGKPNGDVVIGDKFHTMKISLDDNPELRLELCDNHYDIIKEFLESPEKIKTFFKGQAISKGRRGSTNK